MEFCARFSISTTAPPVECPVAFLKYHVPSGAVATYVNVKYVPWSSVFNGIALYPTPLFVTVKCTTDAVARGGVTTSIVAKSINVALTTSTSAVLVDES